MYMYNYMREAYAASMQQMYILYLYTDSIFSKYATYVYSYAGYFKPIWGPLPNARQFWAKKYSELYTYIYIYTKKYSELYINISTERRKGRPPLKFQKHSLELLPHQ